MSFCCKRAWYSRLITPLKKLTVLKGICFQFTKLIIFTSPLIIFLISLCIWFDHQQQQSTIAIPTFLFVVLPLIIFFIWFLLFTIKLLCKDFDPLLFVQDEGLDKKYLYTMIYIFLFIFINAIIQLFTFSFHIDHVVNNTSNHTLMTTTMNATTGGGGGGSSSSVDRSSVIPLIFTPIHCILFLFGVFIIVAVGQGIKIAKSSGDGGAGATVVCLGCIGCFFLMLFITLTILIEMKSIDYASIKWETMLIPIWILSFIFGLVTLAVFLNLLCTPSLETEQFLNPVVWMVVVAVVVFILQIVVIAIILNYLHLPPPSPLL